MIALQDALFQAAAQTFEDLSFLLPLHEAVQEPPEGSQLCIASVTFDGPFTGRLEVTATEKLLDSITMNMLGEDNISEVQRYDALMEISNVICGNLLPLIAGHEAVFHMTAPQVADVENVNQCINPATATSIISLDDGWAKTSLYILNGALLGQVLTL